MITIFYFGGMVLARIYKEFPRICEGESKIETYDISPKPSKDSMKRLVLVLGGISLAYPFHVPSYYILFKLIPSSKYHRIIKIMKVKPNIQDLLQDFANNVM